MLPDKKAALLLVTAITALKMEGIDCFRRNFEARQSSNSNIPLWKQRVSSRKLYEYGSLIPRVFSTLGLRKIAETEAKCTLCVR